jgi:hypothetical protein
MADMGMAVVGVELTNEDLLASIEEDKAGMWAAVGPEMFNWHAIGMRLSASVLAHRRYQGDQRVPAVDLSIIEEIRANRVNAGWAPLKKN